MPRIFERLSRRGGEEHSIAVKDRSNEGSRADIPKFEEETNGLIELWPGRNDSKAKYDTKLDVVAVHGLNGHPFRTWTEGEHFWLQDFLPSSMPDARIFTFGYNSALAFTGSVSKIDDYARTLLERLRARRREYPDATRRPVIFICHSLGGIVVKKALIIAHERSQRYETITRDVHGIVFMGTPHRGSDLAFWSSMLATIGNLFVLGSLRTDLLQDLQNKSDTLGSICSQFVERAQLLHILTFYERLRIKGLPKLVVDEHSAIMHLPNEIPIPVEADHQTMCRFANEKSEKYQLVYDCLQEMVDEALEVKKPYDTQTRSRFLQSLKSVDPEDNLRKIGRPSPGTCAWITEEDAFKKWRDCVKNKVLWLWGAPGTGKTTVVRHIIEHMRRWLLRQHASEGAEFIVAFFFCGSRDWLRNTEAQLLRSLLHQILSQNPPSFRYLDESDLEEYVTQVRSDPTSSTDSDSQFLWKSLSTVLQRSKETTFWIFVEAMDELSSSNIDSVIGNMQSIIQQDLGNKVKLVLSDRVSPWSRRWKEHLVTVELHSRTEVVSDVQRYISTEVENLCSSGAIPWRYQTQIEGTLIELSDGNFLQASLAWANFHTGVSYWSPQTIQKRLASVKQVSKEASAYYCNLLDRIPEDCQELAKMAFTWVLGARKPLSVQELQHAVAISSGQTSWSDLTESLGFNFEVQFDQAFGYILRIGSDEHVKFAHLTVKELLVGQHEDLSDKDAITLSKFRVTENDIDAELAKACIIVLSFRDFLRFRDIAQEALSDRIKDFLISALYNNDELKRIDLSKYDESEEDLEAISKIGQKYFELKRTLSQQSLHTREHTFLSYCISYWNHHCRTSGTNPEVVDSLTRFVRLRQSHFFHLIAMFLGLARVHQGPLWANVHQFDRVPPLHFTMRIGDHPAAVRKLVSGGEDINGLDRQSWTPLCWALLENRKGALETLLDIDYTQINTSKRGAEKPLHLACVFGAEVAIIQRLIKDPRTDINSKSVDGWTTLHWCLNREELHPIALALIEREDLDINAKDRGGISYIDQLFHYGRFENLVLRIIDRKDFPSDWFNHEPRANPRRIDETAPALSYLHMASFLEWYDVQNVILIKKPLKSLAIEKDGFNLLERLAYHGLKHPLVQILDRLPENLFVSSVHGDSKLQHLCAQQDWGSVIRTLRTKYNLRISSPDSHGRTLLHWAAEFHWKSLTSLISENPFWVDHRANDGSTALHLAVEHRNLHACQSLLRAGANYLIKDKYSRLPIHIAAEQSHRSILTILLQRPISDYEEDRQGRSLLHFLAMWQTEGFLRQCIEVLRPRIDSLDNVGKTPLHYASIYGNGFAVRVLLAYGANSNLRDAKRSTALHYALSEGSVSVVKTLVEAGGDLTLLDQFCRNCLHLAIRSENAEVIDYIIGLFRSQVRTSLNSGRQAMDGGAREKIQDLVVHTDKFGQSVLHRICFWTSDPDNSGRPSDDEDDNDDQDVPRDQREENLSWNRRDIAPSGKYIILLHALGADVNARDSHGATPLHAATKSSNASAALALLSLVDTEINAKDEDGCTPLDWAVLHRQGRIVNALREKGGVHSSEWRSVLHPIYGSWLQYDESLSGGDDRVDAEEQGLALMQGVVWETLGQVEKPSALSD